MLTPQLLLCERDPNVAAVVQKAFPNTRILTVDSATEALGSLTTESIALLITEMLPRDMDGFAFLTRVRSSERGRQLPIIVLTSMDTKMLEERLRPFHVAAVLQKPLEAKTIWSTVKSCLDSATQTGMKSRTALLVEKSWIQSKIVSQFLTDQGFEVHVCSKPEKILQELDTLNPQLLMFDVRDCEKQLDALLQRFSVKETAPSKVIALSIQVEKDLNARLMQSGVDCVLTKPLSLQVLKSAMKDLLKTPPGVKSDAAQPHQNSLLIVEDYPLIAQASAAIFSQSGFRVALAKNAEMAIAVMEQMDVDLILLDITLPGMDGVEFLAKLRRDGNETPCVVVTGTRDPEKRRQLTRLGVQKIVEKPVNYLDLIKYIEELLAEKTPIEAGCEIPT
jgi:DNA-binding response OmpR family regulator